MRFSSVARSNDEFPVFRFKSVELLLATAVLFAIPVCQAQKADAKFRPVIPKMWDDAEMDRLELPLANPAGSPKHVSAEYYYKIPLRPIYKEYAVYPYGAGPEGYFDWLRRQEPEIVWGDDQNGRKHTPPLETEADWIKAGELVFDSTLGSAPLNDQALRSLREYIAKTGMPLAKGEVVPFARFVIHEKGKLEIGFGSCGECHTRVMPDGTILKGAQGNEPGDRKFAVDLRLGFRGPVQAVRALEHALFAGLWQRPDPLARVGEMSIEDIAALHENIPPGVFARHRASPFYPVQVPDLIGVKNRRYLDRTGLQLHGSTVDLMRYAALNQGADLLSNFNGAITVNELLPAGGQNPDKLPDPEKSPLRRYSDEQLYALALFLYSLQPPPNPNPFNALARRGKQVFEHEGCGTCHTPPLFTNNKLLPATGFHIPEDHFKKYDVLQVSIGTDPNLTMNTRRGTGYYKVPSLKGVWYRNMFEHSGSVATLEDWFDPKRLREDYVPTGFRGYNVKTRAVPGHEFGLKLSTEDKSALIAYLKTL